MYIFEKLQLKLVYFPRQSGRLIRRLRQAESLSSFGLAYELLMSLAVLLLIGHAELGTLCLHPRTFRASKSF